MPPNFQGVMAEQNRCEVKARVLDIIQDSNFKDKWNIEFEILEMKSLSGPTFANVGDRVKGFAFEPTPNFTPYSLTSGSLITLEAEFIGDERGGKFRLHKFL